MTKEEKIKEYLKMPIKVGDYVYTDNIRYNKPDEKYHCKVIKIENNIYTLKHEVSTYERKLNQIEKDTAVVGENPFSRSIRHTSYIFDVWQLFQRIGIDVNNMEIVHNIKTREKYSGIYECNFNPHIIDKKGKKQYYQREYVWNLKQKQRLIDSVFNHVDIGKFTFRLRSYDWCMENIKKDKFTAFKDIVDGKQRTMTLVTYCKNLFPSSDGIFWNDLSKNAQRTFLNYRNMQYVEMPEDSTDQDTLKMFMAINHLGVPQSEEHINFVKNLLK